MRNHTIRRALTAAAVAAAVAVVPASASAATATVQVEGELGTRAPAQSWTIGSSAVDPATGCPGNSVSAAIEAVTGGDWDRQLFIQTIMGETHTFGAREEYWSLWQNNDYANFGACDLVVAEGDRVLIQATLSGPSPDWIPESKPVDLIAPAVVDDGVPFTVTVKEWAPITTNAMPVPASVRTAGVGYVVSDGTATSTTTGSAGTATLTLTGGGPTTIKATSTDLDNWGRSIDVPICVDDGISC